MRNSARNSFGWRLVAAVLCSVVIAGCNRSGDSSGKSGGTIDLSAEIPPPPAGVTDASPIAAFRSYGDSLHFSPDSTPGSILITRPIATGTARLRISSELRLPNTSGAAYTVGRIIAKFETLDSGSAYNTPVGSAYLWVRDTGGGHFAGTLIYTNAITGDTGRLQVPSMLHSTARIMSSNIPECIDLSAGDTTRACCLCGGTQYNCPFSALTSYQQLENLLVASGRRPRP